MTTLIAHDWIEDIGGSEKVVDRLASAFPGADLATLWSNAAGRFPGHTLLESGLARTPIRRSKAASLPAMSRVWRSLDARCYDRAVISTHAFAHHLGAGRHQGHLRRFVYVHSPARWIWARDLDPRGSAVLAKVAIPALKRHDRRWLTDGDYAANSQYIADRVMDAWGVSAQVIHPPVDTAAVRAVMDWSSRLGAEDEQVVSALPPEYLLGASRFISYKRLEQVIAFGEQVRVPVVLAGSGPLRDRLLARARSATVPTLMVDRPSDQLLRHLMQRAQVFVYPPIEDFGIMPVEAYALGTPAVVNEVGGAAEAARATGGGVTVSFERTSDWGAALETALALPSGFDVRAGRLFSHERFEAQVASWVR